MPGQSLVCGEPSDGQRAAGGGAGAQGLPQSRHSAWPALLGMVAAGS